MTSSGTEKGRRLYRWRGIRVILIGRWHLRLPTFGWEWVIDGCDWPWCGHRAAWSVGLPLIPFRVRWCSK